VFVIVSFGGWHMIDANAGSEERRVGEKFAVLWYWPHLSAAVVASRGTLMLAPGARSLGPQLRGWLPGRPLIVQSVLSGLSIQVTGFTPVPAPPGRLSSILAPFAVPVPAALLLASVTVKPIGSPALTVAMSAVFVIVSFGGWHVIDANA